jgi:superfamily II DNA or RNA helicase
VSFNVGSLVRARGREWVVQPGSEADFLILKPLGGTDAETTGVYVPLEPVEPAQFDLPNPAELGDARSAGLLRDAVRLSFRSSAGPFRSFARIAVEPRPYQLVPLLMALKQEVVRLLIADDVGIGKTIEAALIARELLDRGEVSRLAVLCPPHLAEQWQKELREKFHIDAALVLPSTASRLERGGRLGESLFERYPLTIVSTDFIKAERRRLEFLRTAPELIIVDEAHTCADSGDGRGGRHQRHELLRGLADDVERHLILVTATPHSGKEEAFRSLLSLLDRKFTTLPDDLSGRHHESLRRELARVFVQRKRGDIRAYLDEGTTFPVRDDDEVTYTLSPEYKRLFERVLRYAREIVQTPDASHRQRVRWWSALSMLRALASSPAAAAATLRNRATPAETETDEEADEVGRRTVLDLTDDQTAEGVDVTPGAQVVGDEDETERDRERRRLNELAREAEAITPKQDAKLQKLIPLVRSLVNDGRAPIVFCRFIHTAEYLAEALREALPRTVDVQAVTGTLPPEEREARVEALGARERRVLVATDCLSEGINLQAHFDSVIHYDLAWNPTRHEQREGRVDRFGQAKETVVVRTLYGTDNQIDGVVLDVLIRKHKTIRNSLGISVPVPVDSDEVIEAIFEGLLLKGLDARASQQQALFEDLGQYLRPRTREFTRLWDAAAEREKRSRTLFAQETIKVNEVAAELKAAREAVGSSTHVARFMTRAVRLHGGVVSPNGAVAFDLSEAPKPLRETLGTTRFRGRFELPVQEGELYLSRTHPLVEKLATYVVDTALDPLLEGVAKRAGVMRTHAVTTRTTLLLVRFRYHLISEAPRRSRISEAPRRSRISEAPRRSRTTTRGSESWQLLAEEVLPLAFTGAPEDASWLPSEATEPLLEAEPSGNVAHAQAQAFLQRVIDGFGHLRPILEGTARERSEALLEAHARVRSASGVRGLRYKVEPLLPLDVLGVYVYLPAPA